MDISVVIPVYGCKDALGELHKRLTETLSNMTKKYEIILVNDACPQDSWSIIENLCHKDRHVKGIELSRNFGQMKAILAGLDNACGEWIVVMDCDLQDRPEEIPNLYKKALEGYDVVFARRKERQDSRLKIFWAELFYKVYRYVTDGNYDGALCNFTIINKKVKDNYCKMREFHRGYVTYLKWLGFKQAVIDVKHDSRFSGKSSYSFKKRIDVALELLLSQSDKILRLFVKLGFLISFISFIAIICLVIFKFTANVSIGWTSLIASVMLMGGITIIVIGVVGMYVGNIFIQTKNRPLYIIRQTLNEKGKEEKK